MESIAEKKYFPHLSFSVQTDTFLLVSRDFRIQCLNEHIQETGRTQGSLTRVQYCMYLTSFGSVLIH